MFKGIKKKQLDNCTPNEWVGFGGGCGHLGSIQLALFA